MNSERLKFSLRLPTLPAAQVFEQQDDAAGEGPEGRGDEVLPPDLGLEPFKAAGVVFAVCRLGFQLRLDAGETFKDLSDFLLARHGSPLSYFGVIHNFIN